MSDDIPIIFAQDIIRAQAKAPPVAVFLSAASAAQMQQYSAGGWRVLAAPGFRSPAKINLAEVPAEECGESEPIGCTLVSCEVKFLGSDAGARINVWKPEILKFNCAFQDVADSASLAASIESMGYTVLGAQWRDDNSFAIRSLVGLAPIASIQPPDWDRINLIGVRDAKRLPALLAVGRLYAGEERRIGELRVANEIRNDHIARLEDALLAHQHSETFKLKRS
jgi:hypothetical protein